MVHAVSATFRQFEHMSPPAAGMALVLHVLMAAFLLWAPVHHPPDRAPDPIEVTMEAPPPPPEKKPTLEPPKPPPPKPESPPPKAQQPMPLPGLVAPGIIGPKSTAPPMERGETTRELPTQKSEQPTPKEEAAPPPAEAPQQALARPAEPPPPTPPPPAPTLEKELPPIEAAPAPLTSRDIPKPAPPPPEKKPEPPRPPQPHAQPARPAPQQIAPSPLSHLPRNAPSQRPSEPPRSTFVNPADTYAQNTAADSYLQRVAVQVSRYQAELVGTTPNDYVVARFTIARNGSLLGVSIVKSSGKQSLDQGLITAFRTVAPFPPLPADVPGESVTFTLTFGPRFRR